MRTPSPSHGRPPILVWQGQQRAITAPLIAEMTRAGLEPHDYEALDLVRDYYNLDTIGDLLTDALARAGGLHDPAIGDAVAHARRVVFEHHLTLSGHAIPPRFGCVPIEEG
jgi:hypothetical protein